MNSRTAPPSASPSKAVKRAVSTVFMPMPLPGAGVVATS